MANFPGSVWNPAVKNSGETIQPSHVNDAQDEIVAVEAGYRQGTAPLNSSGSTLASLSVTGNSTLVNLSVTGASSFAGAVNVASTSAIAARVFSTAATELANNVWTGIGFEATLFDQGSFHSTAANSSRLTCAASGVYMVGGNILFSSAASTGARAIRILLNDATEVAQFRNQVHDGGSANSQPFQVVSGIYQVSSGQYFTLQAWQDSGSTARTVFNSGSSPVFWIAKVGV